MLGFAAFPMSATIGETNAMFKLDIDTPKNVLGAKLDQSIPELMQRLNVPGLSLALLRDAKLFWSNAYGVAHALKGKPVTGETIFAAASLSKPVVAYSALKLWETGKLKLDGSLADYLPEPYISDEPKLKLITLRHVLSHTSGLPNWRTGTRLRIDFTPGERFSYSGEGYAYLQRVLEKLAGESLDKFLESRVLIPFGMKHSSFIWREEYDGNLAQGHDESGQPKELWKPKQPIAAASLQTTAVEFAQFMIEVMQPVANERFRLNEASTFEMLRPQVQVANKISWGLGWGIQHSSVADGFVHFGASTSGFQTFAIGFKKYGIGLVVLTNSENGLKLCKELVPLAIGGDHPIFTSPLIDV